MTLSELIVAKKFELDFIWAVSLSIGFITWITLRTLKKYTAVLNYLER